MKDKARFRIFFLGNAVCFDPLNWTAIDQQNKWCQAKTNKGKPITTVRRVKIWGDPNFRRNV